MHITEFNEQKRQIQHLINLVQHHPSQENWANLLLGASLHGLALLPGDLESDDIPQPICQILAMPKDHAFDEGIYYLVPADQVK